MNEIRIKYYGVLITKKQFFIIYSLLIAIIVTGLIYFTVSPLDPDNFSFKKDSIAHYLITHGNIPFLVFLVYTIIEAQFFWNRFTKKQLQLIRQLATELGEKNKYITDSIRYSKHIQNAFLPSLKLIQKNFKSCFVLYRPKEIVSGDFFWIDSRDDKIFVAVADCTDHGVPGAILSMICTNAINTVIREHKLTHPAEILNRVREQLIFEFEKSGNEIDDGMDISFCTVWPALNKLEWAGANNPLWIVRSGTREITELTADRQTVGRVDDPEPFTNHLIELSENDRIYLFTDGYRDQFGGINGKKLMTKGFKDHILLIQGSGMQEQKELLEKKFLDWKGSFEQIDDVCVMGICF